jgi:hypothetical protein
MLFDFFNYLYNNDLEDYLNCYSTFLISKKDLKKNILNMRMNVLIDTYLKHDKNKFNYYYYYLNNYKDKYMDKPLLTYDYHNFKEEDEYEDIDDHYKLMFIKNPEKPVIDYEELDKKYMEEELRKQEEKNEYEEIFDEDEYDEDEDDDYAEEIIHLYDDDEYYNYNE